MLAVADGAAVQLRQAVDEVVVVRFDAVVHREVDDAQFLGDVVRVDELPRVAVGGAEEEHVDALQRQRVGECQVGLAVESLVDVGYLAPRLAVAVDEHNLRVGVVDEQTDELPRGVARSAYDSYFYHGVCVWVRK